MFPVSKRNHGDKSVFLLLFAQQKYNPYVLFCQHVIETDLTCNKAFDFLTEDAFSKSKTKTCSSAYYQRSFNKECFS